MIQYSERPLYARDFTNTYTEQHYSKGSYSSIVQNCHVALELVYIVEGSMYVEFERYSGPVFPGELLIINPFETHYAYVNEEHPYVRHFAVSIDLSSIQSCILQQNREAINDVITQKRFFLPRITDPSLTAEPARLMRECAEYWLASLTEPAASYRLLGAAARLLGYLLEINCFADVSPHDIRYRRFTAQVNAFIEKNYQREIRSSELPELFSWTQVHFCRVFKACYGVTFSQYLRRFRAIRALHLMIQYNGDMKLEIIAKESGFSDYSYFTRAFQEVHNVLPGEYARRIRAASKEE